MAETLRVNFNNPIPVFPLANCVLLPHATVPLHIFEERYRLMTRDALDSNGLIAMATFQDKNWKSEYYATPAIRDHLCVGYIARHERLYDGRYNILLQGICRARLVEEIEHDDYRMAILKPTETQQSMEIDMHDHREKLETLLHDPVLQNLVAVGAISNWLSSEIPTPAMIDLATLTICKSVDQRYAMLAESDPFNRAEWLESHLQQTRKTLIMADQLDPGLSEDGYCLN